ncbi:MAG TPA: hypothetical protein DCG49_01820 [Ruminococcus sp.]|nr:hypothetical protein [Ruminococcus sp.]
MFEIQRMGCSCRHGSDFVFEQPQGFDGYLMLYVKSPAFFRIGDKTTRVGPDTFILYRRGTPLYYGAAGSDYINDWMLFESSELDDPELGIQYDTPVYIGEQVNLEQYFQLIADSYYRGTQTQSAWMLVRAMLSEIFAENRNAAAPDLPHYRELLDLRRKIYAQPGKDWNMNGMAKMLNISMPYLHALYKKAFGITCIGDVIQSRMEQAQQYLHNSSMNVEEIAAACGYSSSVHFSRQFKQQFGLSPMQWRRKAVHEKSNT